MSLAPDVDEDLSTSSRRSPSQEKERDWWSADLEGEMEMLELEGRFTVTAGGSVHPEGKADHRSTQTVFTKEGSEGVKGAENEKQGMEVDEVIPGTQLSSNEADGGLKLGEVEEPQAARVEVQGPKRRTVIHVRERLAHEDFSQEEADEIGFVPRASSEPRGSIHWCDNRCSEKAIRYMQIASMVTDEGGEARTINLCRPCYNQNLVQQGKQPLKAAEWTEIVERTAHHDRL